MKKYFELFASFFKIGLFTFGGGYAMLPMLKKETVEKHKWITEEEILDCFAIGQCTPGIIAVNTATYIGYVQNGIIGSIFTTLGVITPSLIIITIIASILDNLMQYTIVSNIFSGIRVAVCALVLVTIINLFKKTIKTKSSFIIFFLAFILVFIINISPTIAVAIALLAGIIKGGVKK